VPEAEPLYREALEVRGKVLGAAHPDYARSLNNLAVLLRTTGRRVEAAPLYEEAVRVMGAALGPEHPDTRTMRANLDAFRGEAG